MNLYLLVIIVIILLDWILDLFKYRAILSSLSPLVPDEFKDMVDAEEYRKNQNYTRKRVIFKKLKNYWRHKRTRNQIGDGNPLIPHRSHCGWHQK